jgi:ribosomal protein RSM22 (predicted rRNA methylase)
LIKEILNLSATFTNERTSNPESYFNSEQKIKAYCTYFLPLNFYKITHLLQSHNQWFNEKFLNSKITVLDFGSGPGTATLALMHVLSQKKINTDEKTFESKAKNKTPFTNKTNTDTILLASKTSIDRASLKSEANIDRTSLWSKANIDRTSLWSKANITLEIILCDKEEKILKTAKNLIQKFSKLTNITIDKIWCFNEKNFFQELNEKKFLFDFVFCANVLNELPPLSNERETLLKLWDNTSNAFLIVEPSHRVSSQRLIRFRKRMLDDAQKTCEIIGPCLHHLACPLYRTKNWCHFSKKIEDDFFINFSRKIFKTSRDWLKYSYLFFRRLKTERSYDWDEISYRAIGDLHLVSNPKKAVAIDLCKPNEKKVYLESRSKYNELKSKWYRGAVIKIYK